MIQLDYDFGMKVINDYHSPSNIYGFILFSEAHPYVKKVMRDDDFWAEFNVKSGANWPIFSVKPLDNKVYFFPNNYTNGTIGMMVMTSRETAYNHQVLHFFNLNDSEKDLPCFIIFALDENNKDIAYQRIYKIKGETTDEVHHSILSIIESVAETERVIRENDDKGIQTTPFVAWEASKILDQLEFKECFRSGFYGIGKVTNMFSILARIVKSIQ